MLNNIPKVTVILSTYNGEKFVAETVESILNQSYKDFEFLIIDDASKDNTYKILERYALIDNRVKLFKNDLNLNISKNLNKLCQMSKGEYIAVTDQDDVSRIDRLDKEIKFLDQNNNFAAVGSNILIIDENSKVTSKRIYPQTNIEILNRVIIESPIAHPSAMIRKNALVDVNYYDTKNPGCDDYDLWFKLLKKYKLANLEEYLLSYRISLSQYKIERLKMALRYTQAVQRKYLFDKQFFSIKGLILHLAKYAFFLFPSSFIFWLFKKKYFI